jgi:biopolymer transport protein ExbD
MGLRRSSKQSAQQGMPELNLLPMMDVVLTILMFFILVAMVLKMDGGKSATVDLDLPSAKQGLNEASPSPSASPVEPLVVAVDAKGAIFVGAKPVNNAQLQQEIQAYLAKNPQEGAVLLNADSQLSYAKIIEVLTEMRAVGGGKVSLAVQKKA